MLMKQFVSSDKHWVLEFKLVGEIKKHLPLVQQQHPHMSQQDLQDDSFEKSQLQFSTANGGGVLQQPVVSLSFNSEGAALFAKITREHIGEPLAIFLDGVAWISAPTIQVEITDGQAVTGIEDREEARSIVRDLNFGAFSRSY